MLDKKYDHKKVEENKYDFWLENDYFKVGKDKSKVPFCVVIPPPNVTGKLHLGHAWDTTLQDIMVRFKRMDGYDALWLPGMDHAGIATQAKVDKKLKEQGFKPREMDREEWLKVAWDWKREYAENIHKQWKTLGLSLDYSKERFTLDEGLSKAVRKVFVDLYKEGLIYRGERIINWDPVQMTALSNEEVIYKDDEGAFYHLKYYLEDKSMYLDVATTRPETLFGDTAIAVNPSDDRYKDLIGKKVILPIVNKLIPIVGDEHADPEFGTGVVKITPAHDPNDFEVGNRHNLERVVVMNPDATMNENAGIYQGLTREECREKLLVDLKEQDLLISIEPMVHNVGHSERSDAVVEPYLSKQWFVKMRPLADRVLENQKNKDTKVNFIPERYEKTMNHWMEITYDWCISRQLWWGHRIPAWYRGEEVYVGMEEPEGEGWIQDNDVLDTWFSSALWPFSTLGWPDLTEDLERY
ncbi:MAG: valine--tRNA ligase, partial [bacterium]|nr:valine--tRNA ligase [bacterium]